MNKRISIVIFVLLFLLIVLIACNLIFGTVNIPIDDVIKVLLNEEPSRATWKIIILESRLPMVVTAIFAGAALSVAGLLLQTAFNNPLAGPSILGVSTGASLGVAIVMLAIGGSDIAFSSYLGTMTGAFIGAFTVLLLLLLFSTFVNNTTMLLIIGILISYLTSSAISLLNFFATQDGVHSYVIWGLGSFNGVTNSQLPIFTRTIAVGLIWSLFMVKPLNAMLLGTRYASNLGINIRSVRNQLLIITGLLTAVVTAFCGPIGFIGLVVPHIARLVLNTSNHNILLPTTILAGAVIALLCTLVCVLPSAGMLPINAITPIIGVPIILYIIINRHKIQYFN